jgi:hypothetical protein
MRKRKEEASEMSRLWIGGLMMAVAALAAPPGSTSVTFNKDVLPVMQRNCQVCHCPGEIGPMSFLSYESTRPWAKAIKATILNKKMPPWFADPQYFMDHRRPPNGVRGSAAGAANKT